MERKTTTKKTRKQSALTLLQAIEAVAERSRDSKMSQLRTLSRRLHHLRVLL